MDEMQRLFNIIAVLTQRLGGEVEITEEELRNPPEGIVTRDDIAQKIILVVKGTDEKTT